MVKNGVIINGVVYEFAPVKYEDAEDCEQCDLFEKCHDATDILCRDIFGDNIHGKAFQKQTEQ